MHVSVRSVLQIESKVGVVRVRAVPYGPKRHVFGVLETSETQCRSAT